YYISHLGSFSRERRWLELEASGGNRVINKKVGDSVELSPNVSPEGITDVHWKYGSTVVAYKETGVPKNNPFQDRLEFNKNNFSLTLRNLKIQDSGDFIFTSDLGDKQRPAIIITLKAVTTKPILTSKVLHSTVNGSCTVLLDCNLTSDINVSYSVTVGNQTHRVSSLQYTIRPEDGATTFTCRVSNPVSEMPAFKTVTCKPASDKGLIKELTNSLKRPTRINMNNKSTPLCHMVSLLSDNVWFNQLSWSNKMN
uniref:Immunoglobulin domain-containing protein n=1 Tax=Kryptolebias marmoratus TaxID=37003 RepID=A0A3Q3B5G7_KRYMA